MREMKKIIKGILILSLVCGLCFAACGSSPSSGGSSSGGSSSGGSQPVWITKPDSAYPSSQYVVATGDGKSMEEAQYKARANLLGIFGMKLSDESVIRDMFQQTTTASGTNWNETVSSDRRISSSAEGILSGCEIKENWNKGNDHYALAVMEKARTINIYTDIIRRLTNDINEALKISNRNTIDGYSRYRVAANIAKDIDSCVNVIRFAGGSASVPAGTKSEREYLVEANNIIKAIPVRVAVTRGSEFDREGRIQSAFAKSLGSVGFRTGDNSSPYVLEVTVALSEVVLANQTNKFARYEITANLIQTSTRQGIVAYSINDRAGHTSYPEAQQRAIRDAEARIAEEYKNRVEEVLSQL